jgi:WD40 repeat protein
MLMGPAVSRLTQSPMHRRKFSVGTNSLLGGLLAATALLTEVCAEPGGLAAIAGAPQPEVAKQVASFQETFPVASLGFNEDGTEIATNGDFAAQEAHIWEWRNRGHIIGTLKKSGPAFFAQAFRYSRDGRFLAVGQTRGDGAVVVRIWNPHTGDLLHEVAAPDGGRNGGMAFTPDGKLFVRTFSRHVSEPGDNIIVHSTSTWATLWSLRTMPFYPGAFAISDDGHFAVVGGVNGVPYTPVGWTQPYLQLLVVDLVKREVIRKIDRPFPDNNRIESVAWSPDGKHFAASCVISGTFLGPYAVKIFDSGTGSLVGGLQAREAHATGLSYTPDNRYLIAGRVDHSVQVLDSHNYVPIQKIAIAGEALAVSHDGRYLAIASGKNISIWELKSSGA